MEGKKEKYIMIPYIMRLCITHATRLVCMTVHKSMDHEENTM